MSNLGNPHWTIDEIAKLKELWAAGHPAKVIARRLGKSENAVLKRKQRLKRGVAMRKGADATEVKVSLPKETLDRLRLVAQAKDMPVSAFIRALVERELNHGDAIAHEILSQPQETADNDLRPGMRSSQA